MNKIQHKRATTSRISRKAVIKKEHVQHEISNKEIVKLAKASHAHDWLRDPQQDIYSLKDGKSAQWPKSINAAV